MDHHSTIDSSARGTRIARFTRIAGTGCMVLLGIAASGCAGSRVVTAPAEVPGLESRLRSEVRTWEGTPHEWGGASRAGADCSGFVMRVYEDVLDVSLPRTTEDQARVGEEVSTEALSPGDLVFFRTAPKTRHVGIYLSDGEFAHASSSEGVRISALDEDYWRRTYWMSRRVLTPAETDVTDVPIPASAVVPRDTRDAAASARFGW